MKKGYILHYEGKDWRENIFFTDDQIKAEAKAFADWAFDTDEEFRDDDFCIYEVDVNEDNEPTNEIKHTLKTIYFVVALDNEMEEKKANHRYWQDLEKNERTY